MMGDELFIQKVSDVALAITIGTFLFYFIYSKKISHPIDYGRRGLAFMVLFITIATLPDYFTYHDNNFLLMFVAGNLLYGGLMFWIGILYGLVINMYKNIEIPINHK